MMHRIGKITFLATAASMLISSPTFSAAAAFTSGNYKSLSSSGTVSGGLPSSLDQTHSRFMGRGMRLVQARSKAPAARKGTELGMILGTDGGILGVGAPELAVILLVGYFILGPSDLYKLTKEIGKFIQNFRTLSTEATKSFESTMEDQLELTELRKAQSELNNAFNFRRSINTDEAEAAFTELPKTAAGAEVAAAGAATAAGAVAASDSGGETATAPKKKKKRRRVKKKKVVEEPIVEEMMPPPPATADYSGDIPDLDMSDAFRAEIQDELWSKKETDEEAKARIREERMDRLQNGQPGQSASAESSADWFNAPESDLASEVLSQQPNQFGQPQQQNAAEQSRFAAQLSNDWNQQIMDNEDQFGPLGKVMERLAILEEEKNAADALLEEEFRLRSDNEEKFYREKRKVLEEAAADISTVKYDLDTTPKTDTATAATTTGPSVEEIKNTANTTKTEVSTGASAEEAKSDISMSVNGTASKDNAKV